MKTTLALAALLAAPSLCQAADSFQAFLRSARQPEETTIDTAAFCVNDEYLRGGQTGTIVAKVADGTARKYILAIKLTARKTESGAIVDRLGVYDVTPVVARRDAGKDYCQMPVIGREFSLDLPGETSFNFESNNSQSSYLSLSIGEDGAIAVASPDMPDQKVATARKTLLALRASELETASAMTVGPEKFLCLVQPGPRTSVAFFPASSDHKSAELLADVYEGGRGLLPAPLGQVGDAPYFLDYDRKSGRVEAMAGAAQDTDSAH